MSPTEEFMYPLTVAIYPSCKYTLYKLFNEINNYTENNTI